MDYVLTNFAGHVDGAKTAADTYPNIFHTVERITAGYVMNTIDFGKLHVQTGVRFEGTQMDTNGYTVTLYPAEPPTQPCSSPNNTGCGIATPVSEQSLLRGCACPACSCVTRCPETPISVRCTAAAYRARTRTSSSPM